MTQTSTTTETWSRTHARYVAGKVAADLRQMQQAYGYPSNDQLEAFVGELTSLLADGFLGYVMYGFKRGDEWVAGATLRYSALDLGTGASDDRSGAIKRGVDLTGAAWYSYLTYSAAWEGLTNEQRTAYKAALPLQRTGANEPSALGGWTADKTYSSAGGGVRRSTLGGAA